MYSQPNSCEVISATKYFLRALGECEEVVRVLAIRDRLEVLVPVSTDRDDHVNGVAVLGHVEGPLVDLNALNSFLLGKAPPRAIRVDAAHLVDPVMRIVPIRLVDAPDLMSCCHFRPFVLRNSRRSWREGVAGSPRPYPPSRLGRLDPENVADFFFVPCRADL